MRELMALTGRHLRTTARSRAAAAALVLFVGGLGFAAALGGQSLSASLLLLAALLVLVLMVTGFSIGAGSVLPDDRVAGREEWLATLAPPAWKRRLAVVLAGWLLAAGVGLLGGALVGAVGLIVRSDLALRAWGPASVPGARVLGGSEPVTIVLPQADAALRDLEIEVQPFGRRGLRIDHADIVWTTPEATGRFRASVHGPLRFRAPAGASAVKLASLTPGVSMRVVSARRLGPARAPIPTLAWVGLLLGLCAGSVAPVAVLLSRATTGQTAAAGAFCLLLLGSVKDGMGTLAARLDPSGIKAIVPALLGGFSRLTPDAPVLDLLVEATAQRAPAMGAFGLVLSALLYTVLVTVLACVPAPAWLRSGVNT